MPSRFPSCRRSTMRVVSHSRSIQTHELPTRSVTPMERWRSNTASQTTNSGPIEGVCGRTRWGLAYQGGICLDQAQGLPILGRKLPAVEA